MSDAIQYDIQIMPPSPIKRELTTLEDWASLWLTDEWIPFSELKRVSGLDWDVFNSLALAGYAETKIISPYKTNGEGTPLYLGSKYEFRLIPPEPTR